MTAGVAAAVAASGLPTALRLPDTPLDDETFAAVVAACEHHRILGLLGTAVRAAVFPVTGAQRDAVEARWAAWLAHALRLERLVLDAVDLLDRHGIPAVVLKGVALAHTVYPDPAVRLFGDADLLVAPQHFTRAANCCIAELGATRALPELRPGFDDRFGKEILLRVDGRELDLHRTFAEGALGQTIELTALFADPVTVTVGGRSLAGLGPTPRLLHAAYDSVFGTWPPRLGSIRDFAQLVLTDGVPPDARATASRWRATAVLDDAVALAASTLGLDPGFAGALPAGRSRPSRVERALVDAHRGPGRGYSRQLAALAVVPGVRTRWSYAVSLVFPDRAYREARGLSRTGPARRTYARLTRR